MAAADARDDESGLLDQLSTGVLTVDAGRRVKFVNAAAETLLGLSARRSRGEMLVDLGAQVARLDATAARAMADRQPFTERAVNLEQAGGQPMVDIHYTPIQKAEKTALLIELVPVQRHRELSDVEARERQQHALGELLRGLAHEIKNPLGGLRGAAQLLERELDRDELRDYTRVITAEADRLAGLVDRFQNPARHRGRMAVNIHEVLEHVLSLMAAEYGASLTLERDYDPSIPDLLGDRDRLVQVFLNLVSNAAEAGARRVTLRSRVRRQVPLGLGRQASAVAVEVIDDGPGVPPELRDMLFYPLVSGRSHGSGLGLSIAQGIAAEHGGIIRMDSRPGHTVFTCLLPLHRKDRP